MVSGPGLVGEDLRGEDVIDILREELRPLEQTAQHIPGQPHVSTLFRWAGKGVHGCRLETVLVGGRRFTSLEAVQRFVADLTHQTSGDVSPETKLDTLASK